MLIKTSNRWNLGYNLVLQLTSKIDLGKKLKTFYTEKQAVKLFTKRSQIMSSPQPPVKPQTFVGQVTQAVQTIQAKVSNMATSYT